jgi:dolichol-phosphate mannosyltransferase
MPPLISIIVPAYNERDNVQELARRLGLVFAERLPGYGLEAIIVENGSADDTWKKLEAVHLDDPRFKAVQLARNFRMDGGITAGLQYATGDAAVIMTADLQDPPEVIPELVARWEEGYENVYGIVTERQGTGPMRRLNSKMFYWLAGKLTGEAFPRNASDFRLVDRRVYEAVRDMDERNRFMRGLFAWVGFRSIGVPHTRPPRFGGVSHAHTFKVLDLAMKGIFAHSYVLLKLISLVGVALSVLSVVALALLTFRFVLFGVPFAGFGTIVCLVILLFGFLFTMLGVMSEYVGLIYEEVKQRPNFVVRQTLGIDDPATDPDPLGGGAAGSRRETQRSW